jgi:hypothetical protein
MFSRVFAAACAAALGAGAMIGPSESFARGGAASAKGGAASFGHVGGARSAGVRPSHVGVRPFHHGRTPFLHARHAPHGRGAFVRVHEFRAAALRHYRAIYSFGLPLTYADSGPFFGSYYDPSDVVGSVGEPAYADPPADAPPDAAPNAQVAYDRGGCRSQTVTVASSNGSERSVTIMRC